MNNKTTALEAAKEAAWNKAYICNGCEICQFEGDGSCAPDWVKSYFEKGFDAGASFASGLDVELPIPEPIIIKGLPIKMGKTYERPPLQIEDDAGASFNGWKFIESKADLPKEHGLSYYWTGKNGKVSKYAFFGREKSLVRYILDNEIAWMSVPPKPEPARKDEVENENSIF